MSEPPHDTATVTTYETLLLELAGAIATVTLNRPKVLNALNAQVFNDLEAAFTKLAGDAAVRVILLTGAGEKAFAAGADIGEIAAADAASGEALARRGHAVMRLMETCGKPVIACVNGFALGGGCELALACTMRLASQTARLGTPEIKLGLIPGYGGTQRLPRLIGPAAALRMLLTGAMVPADEAMRLGLVDGVVPPAELMAAGRALALELSLQAPLAMAAGIRAVREGAGCRLMRRLGLKPKSSVSCARPRISARARRRFLKSGRRAFAAASAGSRRVIYA